MALYEHKEERLEQPVDTPLYTGTVYTRILRCAQAELDDVLGSELLPGSVLPDAWGGPGTTNVEDARLQSVNPQRDRKAQPGQFYLVAQYLAINTYGARATAYIETDKSRQVTERQHEKLTRTIGMDLTAAGAGIPAVGDTLDAGAIGTVTTAVCVDRQVIPGWQHGRVLVLADWRALKAYVAPS
jgi:hypothetical protein